MSYFDSAKNRALWMKELSQLREEKERREKYGYSPETVEAQSVSENPHRVRVTYEQLEQEDQYSRETEYLKSMEEKRERWRKQREAEYQKEKSAQKETQGGKERAR